MHFYSDKFSYDNELVITCYLHKFHGYDGDELEWDLSSIQSVTLLPPYQLRMFLECFQYIFPEKAKVVDFKAETLYLFNIVFTGPKVHDFKIITYKEVGREDTDVLKLH